MPRLLEPGRAPALLIQPETPWCPRHTYVPLSWSLHTGVGGGLNQERNDLGGEKQKRALYSSYRARYQIGINSKRVNTEYG